MRPQVVSRAAMVCALFCTLTAPPSAARTSANPQGRAVLDATSSTVAPAPPKRDRAAAPAAAAIDVPLPAGSEEVGATWYDLQDMGSLGRRIEVGADGRVHITWQDDFCELGGGCPPNLAAPNPHPNRGMGYAIRATTGTWNVLGKVTDTRMPVCCGTRDLAGGFGTIALLNSGRAAIAQHLNEDGCDMHGYFQLEDAVGSPLFRSYLTQVVSPSYLFPQVSANANGSFTVLGEVPRGGSYDETNEIRTSYLAAPGTFFSCFGWQMGAWTAFAPAALFRDGLPAFPSLASSSNGRVGVAVGDLGGNVYLIESSDGTFAPATVTTRNLTNYTDAQIVKSDSTSLEYRPYVHCHLAYNDTTPNVVWSEWQARKSGATVSYYDYRSRIRRWSPQRGVETVYQVPAGVADHFDDIDNGLAGPIGGFNTLSVDWPQVGFSPDGSETYVAFLAFKDSQVDATANAGLPGIVTGIGFGEIYLSLARTGAFNAPQNLTNTPMTDERFFSLAPRNPGGKAHVVFQASSTNQAGCTIIGDRGTTPGNLLRKIAYLAAPLTGTLVAVGDSPMARTPQLRVSPNPLLAHGRLRLEAEPAAASRRLEVLDLSGRRVASLDLPAGESAIEWSGHDERGRAVSAGVYFARLEGQAVTSSVRFVVAR